MAVAMSWLQGKLHAEELSTTVRPVTSLFEFGYGSSHLADTYLSPLKYDGWQLSVGYRRYQAMKFNPRNWLMALNVEGRFDRVLSPKRNGVMYYGGIEASWSMLRRYAVDGKLSFGVGGSPQLDLGCFLNQRNGNNPASAKASIMLAADGFVNYALQIGHLDMMLRNELSLPVVGAFFSPAYGELYYEIWLGNHGGLAHPAWWGNYFKLRNQLNCDMMFGSTLIRVGYRFDMMTSRVNYLTTRKFAHSAVFGIGGNWLSVPNAKKISPSAKVVMATY